MIRRLTQTFCTNLWLLKCPTLRQHDQKQGVVRERKGGRVDGILALGKWMEVHTFKRGVERCGSNKRIIKVCDTWSVPTWTSICKTEGCTRGNGEGFLWHFGAQNVEIKEHTSDVTVECCIYMNSSKSSAHICDAWGVPIYTSMHKKGGCTRR